MFTSQWANIDGRCKRMSGQMILISPFSFSVKCYVLYSYDPSDNFFRETVYSHVIFFNIYLYINIYTGICLMHSTTEYIPICLIIF